MASALEPVQTIFTACVAVTVANAFWIAVLHAKQTILLGRIERAEERIGSPSRSPCPKPTGSPKPKPKSTTKKPGCTCGK